MLVGNLAGNIGNYIYHLLMGRMLGPVDYGALEAVIALVYYFGIPVATLNLVVVKKVSYHLGRHEEDKVCNFYQYLTNRLIWFCLVGGLVISLLTPIISRFLHLNSSWPILAIGASSLLAVFVGVNLAILQGYLQFFKVSANTLLQVTAKVILAFVLVRLGWSVLGAALGFTLGTLSGLLLSIVFLRRFLGDKKKSLVLKPTVKKVIKNLLPSFVLTLAFTSFYMTDVVLARHLLSEKEAGLYAALSVLGKIVFFASSPVLIVTFPIIAQAASAGKKHRHLLLFSLGLVGLISGGVLILYGLVPDLVLKLTFGSEYLEASPYLFPFGLFVCFYGLASLLAQYFLSIGRDGTVWYSCVAAVIQIFLIFFFHSSISQLISISFGVCFGLFLLYGLVYLKDSVFLERGKINAEN